MLEDDELTLYEPYLINLIIHMYFNAENFELDVIGNCYLLY
jgi:hypothetical protein